MRCGRVPGTTRAGDPPAPRFKRSSSLPSASRESAAVPAGARAQAAWLGPVEDRALRVAERQVHVHGVPALIAHCNGVRQTPVLPETDALVELDRAVVVPARAEDDDL